MAAKRRKQRWTDYLEAHSLAKAGLIERYIAIYLNILELSRRVDDVLIADLMCGEGTYKGGEEGTAVRIVRAVREHHYARKSRNRLLVVLNDTGSSEIEPGRYKIERVREACEPLVASFPEYITVEYHREDALALAERLRRERGTKGKQLLVVDPTGYSQFTVEDAVEAMGWKGTEVILFIPIPQMHRFREAVDEGHPLSRIVQYLWPEGIPDFSGAPDIFAKALTSRLDARMGDGVYTAPITLEKDSANRYLLLYFTKSLRGLELVVDEIWSLDPSRGEGYRRSLAQAELFGAEEGLAELLLQFLSTPRTNTDVAAFILTNIYRISHATPILRAARKGGQIQVIEPSRGDKASGFYISHKTRKKHNVLIGPPHLLRPS